VPSPSRPLDTRSSNEIYSRLFNDVANAYSGTDSVLDRAGVRQANESKRKVNMTMTTDDGQSAMSLEVAESRIIPFHVAQVTASTWGLLSKSTCATDMDVAFKKVRKRFRCVGSLPGVGLIKRVKNGRSSRPVATTSLVSAGSAVRLVSTHSMATWPCGGLSRATA
jgi:hypothetical protein